VLNEKLNVAIKSIPTQRDFDGIPLSSRNVHLSKNERKLIRFFSSELLKAKKNFQQGKNINLNEIIKKLSAKKISIEYLEHLHPHTLQKARIEDNISLLAGAIRCGETRLIDHVFLMKRKPIMQLMVLQVQVKVL